MKELLRGPMQEKFNMIYNGKSEKNVDDAYGAMNEILRSDLVLMRGCLRAM